MAVLPRVALIALIVCVPDVPLAGAEQASCTPGESVTTALPPLAYQPNTFKPYYIGVAGGDLPYEIASSNGSHCSVEGEVTRAVELHPFVNPAEADVVASIPLATARFDVMLDVRLPVTPPARRCNYADVNGDPLANADCFHASQDPTSDPEQAAKWTARVRVVKANGSTLAEYERAIWINLAQLPGITAATPIEEVLTAATQFVEQENWDHMIGLFPIAVFAEGPHPLAVTDPMGRRAGYLTANDIPNSTYVTYGTESMIVIQAPQDGLHLLNMTVGANVQMRLSWARLDYTKGLGQVMVDEVPGREIHPLNTIVGEFQPRYAFVVKPAPVPGASPYARLIDVIVGSRQLANNPLPSVPVLDATSWVNAYRLSRTGSWIIHGQAGLVADLIDRKLSFQVREARSGRDAHRLDAEFDRLIATSVSTSRELALRALLDASINVRTDRQAKRINVGWEWFAIADQYARDGNFENSVERYLYAFREATFLIP